MPAPLEFVPVEPAQASASPTQEARSMAVFTQAQAGECLKTDSDVVAGSGSASPSLRGPFRVGRCVAQRRGRPGS